MVTRTAQINASSRFRSRKLSTKQNLPVLRESDLDPAVQYEDPTSERQDALNSLPKLETGVEQKEEKEHHLQAVITASHAAAVGGKVAQIYIPTPDAVPASGINYSQLYPPRFAQPATYIRFSSTVEDSIGCPYCMTDEDEVWLKSLNERRKGGRAAAAKGECSEDQFEAVMQFFEDQSIQKQPFAAVDNTPVLAYPEMEASFDETVDEIARKFAKDIYEYWKTQRTTNENKSLMAKLKTLKMDAGQEADDSDPYVCFRRREVRQVRKTRGRDAQVTERLRKLRKELEDARQLLDLVKNREVLRSKDLAISRQLFVERASVREMKRTLNIHGREDDELLITQKTPKKRAVEQPPAPGSRPGLQLRVPPRLDGLPSEIQTILFSEKWEKQQQEIAHKISESMDKHEKWNAGYIDATLDIATGKYPISPADEEEESRFVKVKVDYPNKQLLTPPPSVGEESASEDGKDTAMDIDDPMTMRWARPGELASLKGQTGFRLRYGRNGRLWLDRRTPKPTYYTDDRWKYDHEDGDDSIEDPYEEAEMFQFRYRVHLKHKEDLVKATREQEIAHRRQMALAAADVPMVNGQSTAGG